jgi:hypothetical protein
MDKQFMSKDEIKSLLKIYNHEPYYLRISNGKLHKQIAISECVTDKVLGYIRIETNSDEDDFYVEDATADRGLGKLLYFIAMDTIYPKWLRPDCTGFSNDAKRVWSAFDQLDYVESKEDKAFEVIDIENDKANYSDRKYRFTFKNVK